MKAVVTRYDVTTEYPIAEPIRIAHISDLHERSADDILALLRREAPDLIAVTGDTLERYNHRPQYELDHKPIKRAAYTALHAFNHLLSIIEGKGREGSTENAYRFMEEAAAIAPVYVSLGNHEQRLYDDDLRFYHDHGITLLDNAAVKARVKGFPLLIGGMSPWDFEDFLKEFPHQDGFKLLLCHHPEFFEPHVKDTAVDLTLSGHTHGGQIRVGRKGRGFFVPGQGICGRYAHGQFFGGRLIVSAGCSNTAAIPRWGNPFELVIVTLKGR